MIFSKSRVKDLLGVAAPLLFVVGCGGGTDAGLDQGAATDGTAETAQTTPVSGRVADGYIRGATICVDINENGQCDADEPQTVSGEGGTYDLDVPADAADKPILAIVPPEAVDEDTGEPVGKELHFSTPGDRPEFVSPITTLVHQELKNNPSLSTEDAESAMKETLGMSGTEDASLFTDYVAESESGDEESRETFHYLHQTARVLATMMGDIEEDVLEAAEASGLDVNGDPAIRAAILQLVREQLKELLPEISAAVADELSTTEESDENGGGSEASEPEDIDPEAIAEGITPTEVSEDIVTQIEHVQSEKPVEQVSMETLLTQGFYILDVDCHHDDSYGPEDGIDDDVVEPSAMILNDEGAPELVELPEYCSAYYSYISLNQESSELQHEDYVYDAESGQWIEDQERDDEYDERPHLLVLQDGQWQPMSDEGPEGKVEFTADGAAVMSGDGSKIVVYATQRELDGTSVLHHLKYRGADESVADLVDGDAVFAEDSTAYKLHIKRDSALTVLFNWYPEDSDNGTNECAQFGGNCNAVGVVEQYQYMPLETLAQIQEGSLNGMVINDMFYDDKGHYPIDVKFTADKTGSNVLPESGTVAWVKHHYYEQHPGDDMGPCQEYEEHDTSENKLAADGSDQTDYENYCKPYDEDMADQESKVADEETRPDGTTSDSYDHEGPRMDVIAESRWYKKVEQGVDLIEIEIPITVHHRLDQDEMAALLLIEQGGFVRRGARFGSGSVDDEVAYSEVAFGTLKPIIEKYVSE